MKSVFFSLLFFSASSCVLAQSISPSTLNATGGSNIAGSTYLDWSMGEMCLVQTYTSGGYTITQGILQSQQSNPTGIATFEKWDAKIYPNPTTGLLIFDAMLTHSGTIQTSIFDATGKLILIHSEEVQVGNWQQTFNLENEAAGNYFLQIQYTDTPATVLPLAIKIQKH